MAQGWSHPTAHYAAHPASPRGARMVQAGPRTAGVWGSCVPQLHTPGPGSARLWGAAAGPWGPADPTTRWDTGVRGSHGPQARGLLPTHPLSCAWSRGTCAKVERHRRFLPRLAQGQSPVQRWQSSHILVWGQEIVLALHSPRALKGENKEGKEWRRQRMP